MLTLAVRLRLRFDRESVKPVSYSDCQNAGSLGFDPESVKLQVKYTNQAVPSGRQKFLRTNQPEERDSMLLISVAGAHKRTGGLGRSLSSSGSNQAREGRLVDALAVRGDERRDTLR